jgi:cell division septation protein DedD
VEKTLVYDTLNKGTDKNISENTNSQKRESYSFIVQIGAFVMPSNFQRFYEEAKYRLGNDVYYEQINNLYKIRIGRFNTKGEALNYLETVIRQGYPDAFVITVKNPN